MEMKASDDFRDQPVAEVLAALGTDPKQGLGGTEAASRLEALGPNEIAVREEPLWHRVLRRFWGPIPWMIEVAPAGLKAAERRSGAAQTAFSEPVPGGRFPHFYCIDR